MQWLRSRFDSEPRHESGCFAAPPLLEQVLKMGRNLLVVAGEIDGAALATVVVNKIRRDAHRGA
jgi:hypothetical protein